MTSRFDHNPTQPYHISVGAVLVNDEGKILAHKVTRAHKQPEYVFKLGGLEEAYILMRETMENNESIEQAIARGLHEEFGAEGKIQKYLGSLQFVVEGFEKTELFFEVKLTKLGQRPMDDSEADSELVWETPEFLLEKMREQGKKATRRDLDESKIIESYLNYGV